MDATNQMTSITSTNRAWLMVVLIALGLTTVAINQVNIATAFLQIGSDMRLDFPLLVLLISGFFVGYGVAHIPGGLLATRIGMRAGLTLSMIVLGLSCIGSGISSSYDMLMVSRIIAGFGAGVFAAVAPPAAVLQVADHHGALAGGIVIGCFSLGIALGLSTWSFITELLGWRWSLASGGFLSIIFGLSIGAAWRTPATGKRLTGVRITRAVVGEVFGNRNLWLLGIATLAGYGAFLGASQLFPGYGAKRGFSSSTIALAGFLFGISGLPGSVFGGWLQEQGQSTTRILVGAMSLSGLMYILIPFSSEGWIWIIALSAGFFMNAGFAPVLNSPAQSMGIAPENAGTAVGLLLTIMAAGGFAMPYIFGLIVTFAGYQSAWLFFGITTIVVVIVCSLSVGHAEI